MFHSHNPDPSVVDAVFREASLNNFSPRGSVRCSHAPVFRSQLARDLGCLLDVDETVAAWCCLCFGAKLEDHVHVADFMVDYLDGTREHLDAVEFFGDPAVTETFACMQRRHRFVTLGEIRHGHRLQNAKDILRYARNRTPLNDRVRLLAALDETGSMTVAETFSLFREIPPLTAISWMALHRFILIDLEEGLIGPDTIVRRFTR
ncbi:hypothetical protein [Rhizobium leguminosarum]|uniref:hypothetical protein n=1 Tax=Rhizobium leguminosarum TaxID=384 RepID=UPI001F30DDE1|nr:hypothetical protein [Rhizobium leguminosarum]UIK19389.1 hypothetical protein LZK79_10380 [Rhizobium leguminosarum]